MVYEGSNKTYDFEKFKTIHVFGNEIRNKKLLKNFMVHFYG